MKRRAFLTGAAALMAASRFPVASAAQSRYLLFVGSRAQAKGQGIYSCFFDPRTGATSSVALAAEQVAPTAFAVSQNKRYLYSTRETGNEDKSDGALFAYAVDKHSGKLSLLNSISAGGGGSTWIALDATGKTLVVANYGAGCTNAFRVLPDGKLGQQTASLMHYGTGPEPQQTLPHPHFVVFSPDNRFLISPDLGADRVFVSKFDAVTGSLTPNDPPFTQMAAGTGSRQLVFHPSGKFAYLASQFGPQITALAWDANGGVLTELQTVPLSLPGVTGRGGGIVMNRDGKFLYMTSRNENTIVMFAIDQTKGTLSFGQRIASGGKVPWSVALDPAGDQLVVTNQDSGSVSFFQIDIHTGNLSPTGHEFAVPLPVTGVFVPV